MVIFYHSPCFIMSDMNEITLIYGFTMFYGIVHISSYGGWNNDKW